MRRIDRPRARRPRDRAPERAQTLPFTCLFLVMLLVVAGLVIDLGDGYLQRRNVQNVADAAALAAAQGVPTNTYQTDAQTSLHANSKSTDEPTTASDPMSMDLREISPGVYQVIPQSYDQNGLPPRLTYVPIINPDSNGDIPNANGEATIKGFAWFYATGTNGHGSSLEIVGKFVTVQLPPTGQTTTWVPGQPGQVITVELTG
jgi:Putative Flp pilus-assembly TadE/G-like